MTIIGNPIYDRAEEASFFAEFFASFIGNGVYPNPSTGMQVLANNGLSLKIQPGKCFINGYFGLVEDGGEAITIETADSNYNRIDRIVARWDLELRKVIPFVLKGTPASNPVVPSLTRNSNIYEIALADVAVKANATTITQANITDRRLDSSLCGIVSGIIEQVDTTTLFNQYQTWFEERKQESADDYQEWFEGFTEPSEEQFVEWFEGIKNRLGEDVATNLQVQVDELKEESVIVSPTEPMEDRRKVWFQKGKNLFDGQYNTEYGYSQETGKRIVLANIYSNKNLIAIPFGATKMCLSKNGIGISVRIFFYDEDENFITSTAVFENPYIVNIAENARYCNFQTATSNADNDFTNIQLEAGTEDTVLPTSYVEYVKHTIQIKNDNDMYEDFLRQVTEDIKRKTLEIDNPVGHIRMETTNINPATYLGFGVWTLWGSGKVPVGVNTADTDFATVEKTGGSKTVKLTLAQIPSHAHTFTGTAHSHGLNSHTHTYGKSSTTTGSTKLTVAQLPAHIHYTVKEARGTEALKSNNYLGKYAENAYSDYPYSLRGISSTNNTEGTGKTTSTGGSTGHTHSITVTSTNTGAASGNTANATATGTIGKSGSDGAHSNVQPYITCYMWKRTA